MKNAGFSYETATNGKEALDRFEVNPFQAVVMGKLLTAPYLVNTDDL